MKGWAPAVKTPERSKFEEKVTWWTTGTVATTKRT